jgi:hypothetical protein
VGRGQASRGTVLDPPRRAQDESNEAGDGAWNAIAGAFVAGYTSGMKTAISIPDTLFVKADRLAKRMKKSRSQLYQDAVAEYLARYDEDEITESWNRIADQVDTRLDEFGREAARRTLKSVQW